METLEGRDSSVCRYTLLMEKPHIQVTFGGSVLYQTQSGHSHTLLFSGKLSTTDFIRYEPSERTLIRPCLSSWTLKDLFVNRLFVHLSR